MPPGDLDQGRTRAGHFWPATHEPNRRVAFLAVTLVLACVSCQATRGRSENLEVITVGIGPSDQPGAASRLPSSSADGRYVAFESTAPNLVSGDTNDASDVFVLDRWTGTLERASVDHSGAQANGGSFYPSLSRDGRFIVFDSLASNLVPNDSNGARDVFLRDRQTGVVQLVSVSSTGVQGNDETFGYPSISDDGHLVAFSSLASNLVPGDTNGTWDAFTHDFQTGVTARVSLNGAGQQVTGETTCTSMSGDGQRLVLYSNSPDLVAGDSNGTWDVFVRDQTAGTTRLASVDTNGSQGNGHSAYGVISGNGAVVAFFSSASNLVAGDTNGALDVFVRDLESLATYRVSHDSLGAQGNGPSYYPSSSWDGRFIAFYSLSSNLVVGDLNSATDAFVVDRTTGTVSRASVDNSGSEGNGSSGSYRPSISSDGQSLAFTSLASNLAPDDRNGGLDVFLRDLSAATTERITAQAVAPPPGVPLLADGISRLTAHSLSANGSIVVFESEADNLVPGDLNGASDIFVRHLSTGMTTRASLGPGGIEGDAASCAPAISDSGRFVAFSSLAANLDTSDANGLEDIFVRDLTTGITSLASRSAAGASANGPSRAPSISGGGRYMAFESSASNLVDGDSNASRDVFVKDLVSGSVVRVSVSGNGSEGNGPSGAPSISSDGSCVAFTSEASNLTPGDENGVADIFVVALPDGQIQRASIGTSGVEADAACQDPVISADCRYVAFASRASNLAPWLQWWGTSNVFVRDLVHGTLLQVSIGSLGTEGNADSTNPAISGDGRFVSFRSAASSLVAGDMNGTSDVFVRDLVTATTKLVSRSSAGLQANGASSGGTAISLNGTAVGFGSEATNLVPGGDYNGITDLFVASLMLLRDGFETGDLYTWSHLGLGLAGGPSRGPQPTSGHRLGIASTD